MSGSCAANCFAVLELASVIAAAAAYGRVVGRAERAGVGAAPTSAAAVHVYPDGSLVALQHHSTTQVGGGAQAACGRRWGRAGGGADATAVALRDGASVAAVVAAGVAAMMRGLQTRSWVRATAPPRSLPMRLLRTLGMDLSGERPTTSSHSRLPAPHA